MLATIFSGDRNWVDQDAVESIMRKYAPDVVIEGQAPGLDRIAGIIAEELKREGIVLFHHAMPADWDKYHRAAGPIRNKAMLQLLLDYEQKGYEVIIFVFHDDLKSSKGTKNMAKQALAAGIRVVNIKHRPSKPGKGKRRR